MKRTGRVGVCKPSIWQFERAAHLDAATDYVVKGNFDMELTRGHMKLAKGGGRTPWQLLEDCANGDEEAGILFAQFGCAFKGARQLTYSEGLRDDAPSDQVLSERVQGEVIGIIPAQVFEAIHFRGLDIAVLEAAEDGGWHGVVTLLKRERLWWT